MNRIKWLMLLMILPALMIAFVACGGDGDEPAPTATEAAEPLPTNVDMDDGVDGDVDSESVQVEVVSTGLNFAPDDIQVPAATEFSIVYENDDASVPHNLAIFATEEDARVGGDPIAATSVEAGPDTRELSVGPLAAGDYFVWCQVHTSAMTASLIVG